MKKLFGFLFVLAIAFVLFACGKEYKIEVPEAQANVTVEKGESVTITPTFTEGETLVWTSSDDKVVTVEGGKLTAVEVGNATITITISGKEDKAKAEVKVTVKPISVKEVALTGGKASIVIGEEFTLTAAITPDNAANKEVDWATSDAAVASVSNGLVKGLSVGEATISATAKDGSGKKAEFKVTVNKISVNGVSIEGNAEMLVGAEQTLTAAVEPDNATNKGVTFTSSDPAVLTVDENGKVTAVANGTAKVTVAAADDASKTAEISITVKTLVNAINVAGEAAMFVGGEQTLTLTVAPETASNKEVVWSSSDEAVLTVDAEGKVTAVAAGTAKAIATAKDGSEVKGELEITVTKAVETITLTGAAKMAVAGEQTLTLAVAPEDAANKEVNWTSSDTAIATVDENGKVTAVAIGTVKITATAKDGSEVKGEFDLIVGAETMYAKAGATADVTYGTKTLVLNADVFATLADAVKYTLPGGTVVVLPGEYDETVTLDLPITLTSDLADKNPVEDDTDFKDATKAAVIKGLIYTLAKDTTIEGLTFTGAARILRYGDGNKVGSLANFTFQNNLVYDTADATVAWKMARYGSGVTAAATLAERPGFICLSPSWQWVNNTVINYNKFDNVSDTPVFITCTDTVTAKGNLFKDVDRDAMRFDYANDAGDLYFEDNRFENVTYVALYVQSLGGAKLNVEVYSNYFKNIGTSKYTDGFMSAAAIANAVHQEAADCEFTIKYNIFEGCNVPLSLRTNVTTASTYTKVLKATVEFNAFILPSADAKINKNFYSDDNATTNKAICDFNKNFYGTDLITAIALTDANYENAATKEANPYANVYALEKGIPAAAHLPEYVAPTPAEKTVAEAYELDLNTPVLLKGTVSYVYSDGFWLKDETGAIYVYGHADEVKLGDKVEVNGNLYKYTASSNGSLDAKRINFAKEVKVTEAGTYAAAPVAKTEDEFKAITQPGLELRLSGVLVTGISNAYVYCKMGSTEFTINTNSNSEAMAFAAFKDANKTITFDAVTYFKPGNKGAMSVMSHPSTITPEEGFAPLYLVVNPNDVTGGNTYAKFADITLADDMVILFAEGEHDEAITINKNNVTLKGIGEAKLMKTLTVAAGVSGLTIDGLTFAGTANIIGTTATNVTINSCTFDSVSTKDDATIHFNDVVTGFTFTNNYAEFKSSRGIRFEKELHGLTVNNNAFYGVAGVLYDMVRGMDLVDGDVNFIGNTFIGSEQSHIQIRYIGNGTYNVLYNTFKGAACVSVDIREAKTADFAGKAVINVKRNVFDGGANAWGTLRLRNSWASGAITNAAEKVEVNINYNKFINITFGNNKYYVDKPTTACTEGLFNIDYNYSDKGLPQLGGEGQDNWFCNMQKSCEGWFETEAAFELAAADIDFETFPALYDFTKLFSTYAASWGTSYNAKDLTKGDLGSTSFMDLSINLSRACKQSSTINTMPVLGANAKSGTDAPTVYATFTGEQLKLAKYVRIETVKWNDTAAGRYEDIHIEYTKDGENWIVCSAVLNKKAGILYNNVELDGAIAVRLSFTTKYASGNVQLGLKSVQFARSLSAFGADVTLDFMDGTVGSQYTSASWTQEKYTDKWETMSGQMNCREKDGVRVVNFVAGYSMTYKYTYNKGGASLGLANTLTLKAGNYYNATSAIPCKVILIDAAGNNIYLFGTADAFADFPVTTGLTDQSFTFNAAEIVSIQVVTKSTAASAQYLYVGDVHLTYTEPQA